MRDRHRSPALPLPLPLPRIRDALHVLHASAERVAAAASELAARATVLAAAAELAFGPGRTRSAPSTRADDDPWSR